MPLDVDPTIQAAVIGAVLGGIFTLLSAWITNNPGLFASRRRRGDFISGTWKAYWHIYDPEDANDPDTSDVWTLKARGGKKLKGHGVDPKYGEVDCFGHWSALSVAIHYWYTDDSSRMGVVYLTPDEKNRAEPQLIKHMEGRWMQLGRGGRIHRGTVKFEKVGKT